MELFRVRQMDELGRIVIPNELRNRMGLRVGATAELYYENKETIVIKFPEPKCHICKADKKDSDIVVMGLSLCKACVDLIKETSDL